MLLDISMVLIHNIKLVIKKLWYKGHGCCLDILMHSYARMHKWRLGFLAKQKF